MKGLLDVLVFVCIAVIVAQGQIPPFPSDPALAICVRYQEDGNVTFQEYDTCISFCCGGNIVSNATNLECCGSVDFGQPYNPRFQSCCQWWTGHGRGHVRRYPKERIDCCGTHRINWGRQACCYGYPDPPEIFDWSTEVCCNAHRVRLPGVPRFAAQCCGDRNAYDQRFSSCPCEDGQVLNVPRSAAGCCETPEGLTTPYELDGQICCNGLVGDAETNFCCGARGIGTFGDQVCCSGKLFDVVPRDTNKTECCNGVAFDPNMNICCDDEVVAIIEGADMCCDGTPYNPTKSICCQTNLWNIETEGNECCSFTAYFPGKGSFCCNGDVFLEELVGGDACCGEGDDLNFYFEDENQFICCNGTLSFQSAGTACCGTTPFNPATGICCDGQVFDSDLGDSCCQGNPYFRSENTICCPDGPGGPFRSPRCCAGEGYDVEGGTVCCGDRVYGKFRWPSCCVDVGYDAFTHQCCGARILPIPNNSNQGSCCGDNVYDRATQLCCSGENVTIPNGIPRSRAECCDFEVFNTDTHLCCAGVIREKTDRFNTRCCGIDSYNTTEQVCCDPEDGNAPVLYSFEFGEGNTGCCGEILFNQTQLFCCDGFLEEQRFEESACCAGLIYNRREEICCQDTLRAIGNVPFRRAECCGSECYFRGPQTCCNSRIYQANVRTMNTCESF